MTRDDRYRDLTGAWSLDAVSDAERAEFEAHLLDDDDARAEATELSDTAALLGAAVPAETPSPELKTRLMEAIEGLPQTEGERPAPEAVPALATSSTADPTSASTRETVASRSTSPEGRVYRFTRRTAAMFALAAALLVGLTVGGIAVRDALSVSPQTTAISAIRNADDVRTARASVTGGGTAELVWSASQHRSALSVDGVAKPASGKTYQLWYIDADGRATSAGTFTRGSGDQSVLLSGRYSSGDTIGLTVEPAGGSDQPTSAPVVAIQTA